MGRVPGKGRGLPAGGKTRPESPQEWQVRRGSREAYGVAGESYGVGGKEGGREAYRVAENPGWD